MPPANTKQKDSTLARKRTKRTNTATVLELKACKHKRKRWKQASMNSTVTQPKRKARNRVAPSCGLRPALPDISSERRGLQNAGHAGLADACADAHVTTFSASFLPSLIC